MELKNIEEIKNIISAVNKGSIAEELDIEVGDILLSINDKKIEDIIEYKFFISDEYLEVKIQKKDGEIYIYEIEKEYDEDLGIEFINPIIDRAKSCRNKCIFCFIDQLPKGMRETLYFKDDDSRLSFLQGNFITLTNMSEDDIQKMIQYRISPVNISVHTTDPDLRGKMLNNKNAGKLYGIMKRLADAGIEMNAQIVLCPGVNDKANLDRTLNDLSKLHPHVKSVAVVPIGLTKYREGLFDAQIYNEDSSIEVIDFIHEFQKKALDNIGTRFVFLSDEFYVMAKKDIPSYDSYEGFAQIENGVGLICKLEREIDDYLQKTFVRLKNQKTVSIATGESAYNFIKKVSLKVMSNVENLKINVYKIKNEYFGETITVAGLITATDIINQLKDEKLGDKLVIPKAMLKSDEDIFLDNITLDDLQERLDIKIDASKNEGTDFVKKLIK
ncbi:DUF512 domain-containing protein [Tepidibacter aestuarii]|uniref:DUF512 domain-containing protein n=1 Tax=Tepidibacter aestuarii TaxID=2925782 RepID=UPI0020BE9BF7|nr:DUF512 domain-containing protein [Tepidibacter aestuarii]CAH2212767.1 putative radical SAM enzyme, TIGR03279 family [Tepidibacter aestuarii]